MSFDSVSPIVYLDNEEDDRYIIENALQALSIPNPLRFFTDPYHCLDYLADSEEQPVIIMCEMYLQGMNGLELRKRIEEDEYLRKKAIPFVFMATTAHKELIETAYYGTIQGYFRKPGGFKDFVETIDLILRYWHTSLQPNNIP